MKIIQTLAALTITPFTQTICQAVGIEMLANASAATLGRLVSYFSDHTQSIQFAIRKSSDRAWDCLEMALAGDSWLAIAKKHLSEKDKQVVANGFRHFLPDLSQRSQFREGCLSELRAARNAGLLDSADLVIERIPHDLAPFLNKSDHSQEQVIEANAFNAIVDEIQAGGYSNLAWLLSQESECGPLIVMASRYFFRREVEQNEELFRGVTFNKLDSLSQNQADGFSLLARVLDEHGQKLDHIHETTLDLQQEQQRHGHQLNGLYERVMELSQKLDLLREPLRPQHSLSIHSEAERQLVKDLMVRYRKLPPEQRRQLPALLNAIGKLEVAAGSFSDAEQHFDSVVALSSTDTDKAEAYYNGYHAALEQQHYENAFQSLMQAITFDPARWAPFPVVTYEPLKIIGAGGFGVVFLCRHRHLGENVVVKAIHPQGLDRTLDEVFTEAQVLRKITHPAIIKLWDCGYADPASKSHPYLVMEHFDGLTLEDHVRRHGIFDVDEFRPIALSLLQALSAVHSQGILHRDVKPANVLIRREGLDWEVKLIDFGLAVGIKAVRHTLQGSIAGKTTTRARSVVGTLEYASPEQLGKTPEVSVGPYSDAYGFGKTCYYALLKTPEPDDEERRTLPEWWVDALEKCTSRKAEKRIEIIPHLKDNLDAEDRNVASEPSSSLTGSPQPPIEVSASDDPVRSWSADDWNVVYWVSAVLILLGCGALVGVLSRAFGGENFDEQKKMYFVRFGSIVTACLAFLTVMCFVVKYYFEKGVSSWGLPTKLLSLLMCALVVVGGTGIVLVLGYIYWHVYCALLSSWCAVPESWIGDSIVGFGGLVFFPVFLVFVFYVLLFLWFWLWGEL